MTGSKYAYPQVGIQDELLAARATNERLTNLLQKAEDERDEMRKDAERYRFLCDPSDADEGDLSHAINMLTAWAEKPEIDDAIDDAMKQRL